MAQALCCCQPLEKKSGMFVPVEAEVICEAPGVLYVSIDPDVWRLRCQQCLQKTEHKCPLKKLRRKFKGKDDRKRFKSASEAALEDDMKNGDSKQKGDKSGGEDEEEGEGNENSNGLGDDDDEGGNGKGNKKGEDMCKCPDRPNKKGKPKVCLCDPFLPVNFLLEVEVTGEQKPEIKPKKRKLRIFDKTV